ncbi:cytochrome P450 [Paenibacillus sp. 481]|uniref:cytochrome P450 n=1 Tax=Paenibacillus sp. 481 TaxID=2835869 RepID=UPI001E50E419|nr:cytochrome P450 [Paenibacillus sp. 481]UHA73738.1 cytochrome P450 [Paenibacillus sp. 481]
MTNSTANAVIPGPRGWPLLGWRGNTLRFFRQPFSYSQHLYHTYGEIVSLARGSTASLFAFGPEMNNQIFTNPALYEVRPNKLFRVPPNTPLGKITRNNLLMMNGEKHKQQRRLMQPAFHRQQIQKYAEDMVSLTESMLHRWQGKAHIDLRDEMKQLTQHIAVKTLFGLHEVGELNRISELLERMQNSLFLSAIIPFNLPGMPIKGANRAAGEIDAYLQALITRKRGELEAMDVLASLVRTHDEDGYQLSDDELIGHAFTLFVAGHETTANALTWSVFLLSQHPTKLAAVLDELDSVLGGAAPTLEQLPRLKQLDYAIKESLRLMPPAIVGTRVAAEACELGGYAIAPGSSIMFSSFITHRISELYEDPHTFKPERWSSMTPTPYEYLPFSAGPHMCIGAGFASQEIKLVLAMLLQRYRFGIDPNSNISTDVTMRPVRGMPMQLLPVDHKLNYVQVKGNINQLIKFNGG